jgi:hypothetical protein
MKLLKRIVKIKQPPEPPELTYEEKREMMLKNNIGKRIVIWKAKTLQTVVCSEAVPHTTVTSAETIEGTLANVTLKMICVDNKWYSFGYDAEKIYEYKFLPE